MSVYVSTVGVSPIKDGSHGYSTLSLHKNGYSSVMSQKKKIYIELKHDVVVVESYSQQMLSA